MGILLLAGFRSDFIIGILHAQNPIDLILTGWIRNKTTEAAFQPLFPPNATIASLNSYTIPGYGALP